MKTQQEIEERLSLAEKQSQEIDDWCKGARYILSCQSDGAYFAAKEALLSVRNEIILLKWVLNILN